MTSKHNIKKFRSISAILAFVFLFTAVFSSLSVVSFAAAPANYTDITANSSASVTSARYFRFVAPESGSYTFYSSNRYSGDAYGELLNYSGSNIISNDDGAGDLNFSITYNCTAGTTYYIYARFLSSSTGSYTFNVRANFTLSGSSTPTPPQSGNTITTVPGTNTYSLFNSGRTGVGYAKIGSSWSEDTNPNYDETTLTNGGYDIYSNSRTYEYARLGCSFVINEQVTEQARLTIYTYDVDESNGSERDYIHLVDATTGTSTQLEGYLSGMDMQWNTTTFTIAPSLFTTGHEYYFRIQTTGNGGYHTFTRTVSIQLTTDGEAVPPTTPIITDHEFSASISNSGSVSTSLFLRTSETVGYTFEYSASISSNQYGSHFESLTTVTSDGLTMQEQFQLESGAPKGTYQIDVIVKDSSGNVVTTYFTTAGYDYRAVSYDSNGGSSNLPLDTVSYSSGDTVTVLFNYVPSRSGYTFLGWSTSSTATEAEFTENGITTFTMGSSDVTLYAVWAEEEGEEVLPPVEPPVTPPSTSADTWDGTTDTSWYDSTSTEFTIYTAEELAGLAYVVNNGNSLSGKTVHLGGNIDLSGYEWTPIGTGHTSDGSNYTYRAFSGTFNGNGYYIFGLNVNNTTLKRAGLFGALNNATVTMLGIKDANVTITQEHIISGATIAGTARNTTITYCDVSGTVSVTDTSTGGSHSANAGMIVGKTCESVTINSCVANGSVSGDMPNEWNAYVGGIVGCVDSGSTAISNTYFCGQVDAYGYDNGYAGGMIGITSGSSSVRNCFIVADITSSDYKDAIAPAWLGAQPSTSNSYYSSTTSSSLASSTSSDNFKSQSWVAENLGWDFDDVWTIDTSWGYEYPLLRAINYAFGPAHDLTDWIYDVEPTCLTGGHRYKICNTCEEIIVSEDVAPLQHSFEITTETEATCTVDGLVIMTCVRGNCEYVKQQVIFAPGHNFGSDNICDVCQYELTVHEHEYTSTVTEPTCTQIGYTVYTCSCGHEYRGSFVDQLGHSWNEGVITTSKTCTTDGVMTYTCTVCEASYEVAIPAGHDWTETVTTEATCTTDGSMTRTCAVCETTETVVIPAAHTWNEGTVITEATCTEPGSRLCTCTVCESTEEIEIAKLGHSFVDGACTRCGAGIEDVVEPDTEHPQYGMYFGIDDIISRYGPEYINEYGVLLDYNEDAVIKKVAVFLTQEGTMWRRCIAVVGENITYATYVPYLSYDEEIHYTGLNSDWINIFRLSENSDGIWCYSNYATIGVNLEDAQGNLLLSLYDIGQAGAKTRIFDDLDEMIAWLSEGNDCIYHTAGEWYTEIWESCGADGLRYTYCTECGTRMEEVVPATGNHSESGWYTDVYATCGADGSMHTECYYCGTVIRTEIIPATGWHTESDWIIDVAPTAISSGTRHKECLTCHTVLETDTMDILATLTIDNVSTRAGATVDVTLDIQNNPGIIGAALTFEFDPALTLVGATSGGAWSLLNLTTPGNYNSPCTFVWDGLNVSDYANGTIITLTFVVPSDAVYQSIYNISASYSFGNMINSEYENVDVVIENGSITVDELVGDANDDGIVDVADVIALRRYMSSGYDVVINVDQADINDDGLITMTDIVMLRRYITNGSI